MTDEIEVNYGLKDTPAKTQRISRSKSNQDETPSKRHDKSTSKDKKPVTFISSDAKEANPYNDKSMTLTNSVVKLQKVGEANDYTDLKKSESQIVIKPTLNASKYLNSVFDQATISSVSNLIDKGSTHESQI